MLLLTLYAALFGICTATPELLSKSNINYRSPYVSHPALGIDTHEVFKRHTAAREQVRAELDTLVKRQAAADGAAQTARPSGTPSEYPVPNYGLGVVDYQNADYVYAGNLNFTHSVASGDPYDYSVILWTRAYPLDKYRIDIPQCVTYKVYEGENATGSIVSQGYSLTGGDVDWTVKVEATGLKASTWYSYQFANCAKSENKSPVGRTRTAPGKTAKNVATQRFAVYSCSNYPNGFFSAYSGPVVHKDADYVVHLGDYIYEYGTGGGAIGRTPSKGAEIVYLDDYRTRYAQYRTDIDLKTMHENLPIIAIWDDHETANNDWKAGSDNSNNSMSTGGCKYSNNTICFSERAFNAKRAYFEWIPIRQVDLADQARIFREFRFGDLLDVVALDTRKYDRDVTDNGYNLEYVKPLAQNLDSGRSIVGPQQEEWLEKTLSASKARGTSWRLILNQVILGTINHRWTSQTPATASFIINYDAWDGYQANRRRLLQYIYNNQIDNVAVVTGDTHANWLFENTLDNTLQGGNDTSVLKNTSTTTNSYQRGAVVEYGGTAVSSNGWGNSWGSYDNHTVGAKRMVENNPSLLYSDAYHRGYMTVAINYTHLVTSWYEYPGNQQARVPGNRTLAFQAVQPVNLNQVQRPLQQPRFGAIKPGN